LVTLRNSISRSGMSLPGLQPPARVGRRFSLLSQAFGRELGDRRVVVGSDEAGARIDVDRCQPVDRLLAKGQDREITLHEGLLIGSQLHPTALESGNDLRA